MDMACDSCATHNFFPDACHLCRSSTWPQRMRRHHLATEQSKRLHRLLKTVPADELSKGEEVMRVINEKLAEVGRRAPRPAPPALDQPSDLPASSLPDGM